MRRISQFLGFDNSSPDGGPSAVRGGLAVDEKNLEFFNGISAFLKVELSEDPQPIGNLENKAANPNAEILSISLEPQVFEKAMDDFRALAQEELDLVVFRGAHIDMCGESGQVIGHDPPNGLYFSVQDLLLAVSETERKTRGNTQWLGGIDVQHCFFEGIQRDEDGIWHISWGS
jgi:hypothetical protein